MEAAPPLACERATHARLHLFHGAVPIDPAFGVELHLVRGLFRLHCLDDVAQPAHSQHLLQRWVLGRRRVVGTQIGEGGAADPDRIDPGMAVEAAILDRQDGVDQIIRQIVEIDRLAIAGAAPGDERLWR